jgi:hypothetical protein
VAKVFDLDSPVSEELGPSVSSTLADIVVARTTTTIGSFSLD